MTPLFGGYGDLAYRWAGAANIANIKTQPKKCIPYIPKTKPGCCLLGFYSILVRLYISVPGIPPYLVSVRRAIPAKIQASFGVKG